MGGYGAGESARSPIVSSDGNGLERRIQGGMICGGAHEGAHSQLREETRSRDRPRSRTWNGEGSGGLGGAADALRRPCRHAGSVGKDAASAITVPIESCL